MVVVRVTCIGCGEQWEEDDHDRRLSGRGCQCYNMARMKTQEDRFNPVPPGSVADVAYESWWVEEVVPSGLS